MVKKAAVAVFRKLAEWHQVQRLNEVRTRPNVFIHPSVRLEEGSAIQLEKAVDELYMGESVYSRRFCTFYMGGGRLHIENNVFFNTGCAVNCLGRIEIGAHTIFGEGVRIYDHNHTYRYTAETGLQVAVHDFSIGTVTIGKNCWIGSNVTILKNVTIGDNVIVGANCLVYKSIPANSLVLHQEGLTVKQLG